MRRTIIVVLVAFAALVLMAGCGNLLNSSGTADSSDGVQLTIGFPSAARAAGDLFSDDIDIQYLKLDVMNDATGLFEEIDVSNIGEVWQTTFRVMSAHYGEVTFNARAYYSWYDEVEDRTYETLAYTGSVTVNVPGTSQVIIPMVTFIPTTFSISGLGAYAGTGASLLVFVPGTLLQDAIDEALADMGNPPPSMIAQANEAYIDESGVMQGSFGDWSADPGLQYDLYIGILDMTTFSMTILSAINSTPLATVAGAEYWEIAAPSIEENIFAFPTTEFTVNNISIEYEGTPGMLILFEAGTDYAIALGSNTEGTPPGIVAIGMTGQQGEYGWDSATVVSGSLSGIMLTPEAVWGEGDSGGLPLWNPEPGKTYEVLVGVDIGEGGPRYILFGPASDFAAIPVVFEPLDTVTDMGPYIIDAAAAVYFEMPEAYEPDDSSMDATEIWTDGTQNHTLTAGDVDWIKSDLVAGTEYFFETTGPVSPDTETDTYLDLYSGDSISANEASGWIMSDDNSGTSAGTVYSKITFTPTTSGYYYIKVTGSNEGSYSITKTKTVVY